MVTIKLNVQSVVDLVKAKIEKLQDKEYLLRPLAFGEIELMTKRIHVDGLASDESRIGTYSKGYMAIRTGKYGNSDLFQKGAKKGEIKNAGVISRGPNKGAPRPQYHRSEDTKVILSLTRQLENDWSVIATARGYGIGFLNSLNYNKARWAEANYKKKIFSLTEAERQFATEKLKELVNQAIQ
jgi:hypothetical protein